MEIENILIPRLIKVKECRIFGFCDAAPAAHGCAYYIFSEDTNGRTLCFSKSRINNNTNRTFPQLEFAAALLKLKYLPLVLNAHDIPWHPTYVWLYSDSTVAVAWKGTKKLTKIVYVDNRI
jgi:Pao retrotransposon peptidase